MILILDLILVTIDVTAHYTNISPVHTWPSCYNCYVVQEGIPPGGRPTQSGGRDPVTTAD